MEENQLTVNIIVQYSIVAVIVVGAIIWIIVKMVKARRKGSLPCCGCSMADTCAKASMRQGCNSCNSSKSCGSCNPHNHTHTCHNHKTTTKTHEDHKNLEQ